MAYNLNHNTAGPDQAFASSRSEPLGFYQAQFHKQQTMEKHKTDSFQNTLLINHANVQYGVQWKMGLFAM